MSYDCHYMDAMRYAMQAQLDAARAKAQAQYDQAIWQQKQNEEVYKDLVKRHEEQNGLIIDVECRIIEEPKQLENK